MIGFLLVLIIIAVFSAFNLNNTSDIELGFHKFKDVPIFLSLLFAFISGSLIMIPFSFKRKKKRVKQELVDERSLSNKTKKKKKKTEEGLNSFEPENSLQKPKSEEK